MTLLRMSTMDTNLYACSIPRELFSNATFIINDYSKSSQSWYIDSVSNVKQKIFYVNNFLGILSIAYGSNRPTMCEHFNMLESLQSYVFFIFEVC